MKFAIIYFLSVSVVVFMFVCGAIFLYTNGYIFASGIVSSAAFIFLIASLRAVGFLGAR